MKKILIVLSLLALMFGSLFAITPQPAVTSDSYEFNLDNGSGGYISNFVETDILCGVPFHPTVNSITITVRGSVRSSVKGENTSTSLAQTLNKWKQYAFFVGHPTSPDWVTYPLNHGIFDYDATIWDGNTDFDGTSGDTEITTLNINDSITITYAENPTFVGSFIGALGSGNRQIRFGCDTLYESPYLPTSNAYWSLANGCKGTVTFTIN